MSGSLQNPDFRIFKQVMNKIAFTLSALLLLFGYSGFAQLQINDCSEAVVVCDNQDLAFNPDGPGLDDYADPDNDEGCITALEQNSAWYYFQINPSAPPNLVLGFTISPNGGLGEDYDWALYGPNVNCGDLGSPIRCSSSSAACGFCPETGMGMGTTDVTEGPGTGDGFVMTLVVQPGQGFYLMIDNWQGTMNGFVLTWEGTAADYLNCNASPPCALFAVAGPDISACEGDTEVQLNGTSTGGNGAQTYSWTGTNGGTAYLSDPDIANPTVELPAGFTGTITYTLTVVEDTCMNEDQLDLIVNPRPIVSINPIGPFCHNESSHGLTGSPLGGTWGGAVSNPIFNPMTHSPGIHTVTYTYTDANGCSNTAYLDIEVYETPTVDISPDPAEFCDNVGEVLLTAQGADGAGGYSYQWSTPTGPGFENTFDATQSGIHNVTVTDANGCTGTSSTVVTSHANPAVTLNDPGPICETLDVFYLSADPPGGYYDGTVVDASGEILPNMIGPGTFSYSYTYADNHDCETTVFGNFTIIPAPNAIAENNGPVCAGQPILLMGDTDDTGATITYSWTGPGGYLSNLQNPMDATLGGTYILEVSVDGCPSPLATTVVNVINTPDAIAANGGPYCNGEPIVLTGNTSATGAGITYAWSGPGGYASSAQNPTDATSSGAYTLVVTQGTCSSPPAITDVIFSTPPNVMASNTGPYCSGQTIQLNGSTTTPGNTITYTWSGPGGYASALQNPTDAVNPGNYQLIINVDGCNSIPLTTNVVVNTAPTPAITGQDTFCTGFSSILDAGAGFTQYLWSNTSQNQTLEVFASGVYGVTVTDANGCTGQTSFNATELASLSPVITGTLEFCEGGNTILDAGAGYSSYLWSGGEVTQTITVSNSGNQGVIVTDADGCTGSANVTTIEHPNPNVIIGGSSTYCIGGYTILDAGPGYAVYDWSNDSTTQTVTINTPGLISVDIIDIYGCTGSASVNVIESTSLSPVITGSTSFCENGSTTLNAGSGFANYTWSDNSSNQTLLVNTTGTYSVTVSDNQGCSGASSVMVTEVLPPAAVVQPTASVCNTTAGGSVINLYSLIVSGDNGGSWQDLDGSGAVGLFTNLNFNNVPAGDYRFVYTTNSATPPCTEASYQVVITVLECMCPDVFFFVAPPLCNTSDILDLSTLENTAESGTWSLIQTPAGANPASLNGNIFNATGGDPGDYTVQFTLQNTPPPGCNPDYPLTLHVDAAVTAGNATTAPEYCANEIVTVNLNTLITGADPGGSWTETSPFPSQGGAFNPATGNFTIGAQSAGTYSFRYAVISTGICPDDATDVSVIIHPLPIAQIQNAGVLDCSHPLTSLDATGSSSGAAYDITWTGPGVVSDGKEKTLQPTIDQAGTYTMTITHLATGCIASDQVTVIANTDPPTDALINATDPSCAGEADGSIQVGQVTGGTAPYTYAIDNGAFSSSPNFNALASGDYTIQLQDANGCLWDSIVTLIEPSPITIDLGPDLEIGLGETATVQATVQLGANLMDTLLWNPSNVITCIDLACLEVIVHPSNTMTLYGTVVDEFGCKATDDVLITLNKVRRVYIPNAFSPNGDGINDMFFISGDEGQIVMIKSFTVHSRWGEVIYHKENFQPNDASTGWNGIYKNDEMNPGVFVYTAEIEFIDGVTKHYTGDVTLVR